MSLGCKVYFPRTLLRLSRCNSEFIPTAAKITILVVTMDYDYSLKTAERQLLCLWLMCVYLWFRSVKDLLGFQKNKITLSYPNFSEIINI